jgi:curli production assembly/transport component CsgG
MLAMLCPIALAGCASNPVYNTVEQPSPIVGSLSSTSMALAQLPAPPRRLTVAVYDFPDLTGQRRPTQIGSVSELSTAVSQGSSSVVIEALRLTGGGTWFNVLDRTRDADQVRERTILAATSPNTPFAPLPPAEYILNGGVTAFERSVVANNTSAAFLGIGGNKSVVRNFVSVTLRLVRADTAEVIDSVTAYRSIDNNSEGVASRSRLPGGIYPDSLLSKYPSPSDYLEADLSRSRAEMVQIATREAIEAALYELIGNAARGGLWERPARNIRTAAVADVAPEPRKLPPRAKPPVRRTETTAPKPPTTAAPTLAAPSSARPATPPQISMLSPVIGPLY